MAGKPGAELCEVCARPRHPRQTCADAAVEATGGLPTRGVLCPICNQTHPKGRECPLPGDLDHEAYAANTGTWG